MGIRLDAQQKSLRKRQGRVYLGSHARTIRVSFRCPPQAKEALRNPYLTSTETVVSLAQFWSPNSTSLSTEKTLRAKQEHHHIPQSHLARRRIQFPSQNYFTPIESPAPISHPLHSVTKKILVQNTNTTTTFPQYPPPRLLRPRFPAYLSTSSISLTPFSPHFPCDSTHHIKIPIAFHYRRDFGLLSPWPPLRKQEPPNSSREQHREGRYFLNCTHTFGLHV